MLVYLRPAVILVAMFTVLTGLIYPLSLTGIAQLLVPSQANGSLLTRNGAVIGSALIGQRFASDRYFHGRPSSAGDGYDAAASSGSNLGPTSEKLIRRAKAAIVELRAEGATSIPSDAVTTSGSGLDPDISPDYAEQQAIRVARARSVPVDRIRSIVAAASKGRILGVVGEPRINVLELNLALDAELTRAPG